MKSFKKFVVMMMVYALVGIGLTIPMILILGVTWWKGLMISLSTAALMILVNLIGIWLNKKAYEGIS